jgi:MinD-like ATPase involved in chromosome partitioning or flagellar assembly
MSHTLSDYLAGTIDDITQCVYDVPSTLTEPLSGAVFFVPIGLHADDVLQFFGQNYQIDLFIQCFFALIDRLELDILLLDTNAGLNEETLMTLALSDVLLVLLRLDSQDFQGTSVTLEVAHKLEVPHVLLIVNGAQPWYDLAKVKSQIEQTYQCEVAAILPHSQDLLMLDNQHIFVLQHPQHPVTEIFRQIVTTVM